MLQHHAVHRELLATPRFVAAITHAPTSGAALERHVDEVFTDLVRSRAAEAERRGGLARMGVRLDAWLATNAVEHMDDPDFPARGKYAIAQGLHLLNTITGSYGKFFEVVAPLLREVHARTGRPARLLEIGAGAGGFSIALAKRARATGLAVEVTASDIVPYYVEQGRRRAEKLGLPVSFCTLDALDMAAMREGAFDVVFLAQTVHHFTPGQVARMVAESKRVATTAYVAIDGYRSIPMLAFVAGTAALSLWPAMVHDAWVSARRFYAADALAFMARMAAPLARVRTGRLWPLNTTLTVRFDEREGTP